MHHGLQLLLLDTIDRFPHNEQLFVCACEMILLLASQDQWADRQWPTRRLVDRLLESTMSFTYSQGYHDASRLTIGVFELLRATPESQDVPISGKGSMIALWGSDGVTNDLLILRSCRRARHPAQRVRAVVPSSQLRSTRSSGSAASDNKRPRGQAIAQETCDSMNIYFSQHGQTCAQSPRRGFSVSHQPSQCAAAILGAAETSSRPYHRRRCFLPWGC